MKKFLIILLMTVLPAATFSLWPRGAQTMEVADTIMDKIPEDGEIATFAGGCFWCTESEFRSLDGVLYSVSGYIGGDVENPTYREVTTGDTGHAEASRVYYDPEKISYRELADYFLRKAHDPTQLNRQGVDVGTQYRSAIFYHDEAQKNAAEAAIAAAEADNVWDDSIVTTVEPATKFWPAEEYHQQYYEKYKEETGQEHIRMQMKMKRKAAESVN